jgi:hypothetical protein
VERVPLRGKPVEGQLSHGVTVAGNEQERAGTCDKPCHPAQGFGFGAFDVHFYECRVGKIEIVERDDADGIALGSDMTNGHLAVVAQKAVAGLLANRNSMNRYSRFQMIRRHVPAKIGGIGLEGVNVTSFFQQRERVVASMRAEIEDDRMRGNLRQDGGQDIPIVEAEPGAVHR